MRMSSFQEPLSVAERQARNLGSTYHTGDSVRDQGRKNIRRDILYRSMCRLYFIASIFLNYLIYDIRMVSTHTWVARTLSRLKPRPTSQVWPVELAVPQGTAVRTARMPFRFLSVEPDG